MGPYSLYKIQRTLSPHDKIKEDEIHDRKRRPSKKIIDQLKHKNIDQKYKNIDQKYKDYDSI